MLLFILNFYIILFIAQNILFILIIIVNYRYAEDRNGDKPNK